MCARCAGPLPDGSRRNKVYCSKACSNAAYKVLRRVPAERQRAYNRASYHKKRQALLEAIGHRKCRECAAALPEGSRLRRTFCSRYCINQNSLREKREQRYEAGRRRRAGLTGPGVSERDWTRLKARHGGRCAYCATPGRLTMDHVVPVARGGWHAIGNILPACQSCNSSKRDDLLIYWRTGRAFARLAA